MKAWINWRRMDRNHSIYQRLDQEVRWNGFRYTNVSEKPSTKPFSRRKKAAISKGIKVRATYFHLERRGKCTQVPLKIQKIWDLNQFQQSNPIPNTNKESKSNLMDPHQSIDKKEVEKVNSNFRIGNAPQCLDPEEYITGTRRIAGDAASAETAASRFLSQKNAIWCAKSPNCAWRKHIIAIEVRV